jgi:hypothetical protein
VTVKCWKSGEGIIGVTSKEEFWRCECRQRTVDLLGWVVTMYRIVSEFIYLSSWDFNLSWLVLMHKDGTSWLVSQFQHCPAMAQITFSSDKLCCSSSETDYFRAP